VEMTACDLARSSLSVLSLLLFHIANAIGSISSSWSSHPLLQLCMIVGMVRSLMNMNMKTGIVPISNVGVLLTCEMAELFA